MIFCRYSCQQLNRKLSSFRAMAAVRRSKTTVTDTSDLTLPTLPSFENLWHSYSTEVIDIKEFLQQIKLHHDRNGLKYNKTLFEGACSEFSKPEHSFLSIVGVLRAVDSTSEDRTSFPIVKILIAGLCKVTSTTSIKLTNEQEVLTGKNNELYY